MLEISENRNHRSPNVFTLTHGNAAGMGQGQWERKQPRIGSSASWMAHSTPLRADLDRIDILSAALSAFSKPVPDYEPTFQHMRHLTLNAHELG